MAEKEKKVEKVLERTYVIPLRKGWLKAPQHRRAKKAIRIVKEFLARHMKVENRDLSKVRLDGWLNQALWSRGIKSPPHKITVKATKDSNGDVYAEFVSLPKKFKAEDAFLKKKMDKAAKKKAESREKKKKETKKEEKKEEKTEEEKLEEEKKKKEEKELRKEVHKHESKTEHLKGGKVERQQVHKMQTGK